MPHLRVERYVARDVCACSWCGYPIQQLDPALRMMVDGRSLGMTFCSWRCASTEARARGRGRLGEVRYDA